MIFEPDVALYFIKCFEFEAYGQDFVEFCLPVSKSVIALADIMKNITYNYKKADDAILNSFNGFKLKNNLNLLLAQN